MRTTTQIPNLRPLNTVWEKEKISMVLGRMSPGIFPQASGREEGYLGPLCGSRVAVVIGVGMLALARFVEDDPWWGQDSLKT
jgi:hypothetical protein